MTTRLFFTQPYRRWLVRFACWRRCPHHLQDWLADQLYPDDCFVSFGPLPSDDDGAS